MSLAAIADAAAERLPLAEPNLAGNEARYLQECIETGYVSSVGPFVDRFELAVAAAAGAANGVAVASGTAGLHLALLALGVGAGDLVIVPAYSFIASANAVAYCGAEPWFVDIAPESWTLDPALLEATLEAETDCRDGTVRHRASGRRVAAVMAVYTLGHPADMDAICTIAGRHRLPVLADAAAALGAGYKDRAVGRLGAELTVFSFNGNKTITAGGGGAVVGNDADLVDRIRHLSTTARDGCGYLHDEVGYNYRMTNLQAAVGCAQLEKLEPFVAAKRWIAYRYADAFADVAEVGTFPEADWAKSARWFAGLLLEGGRLPGADVLRRRLGERGIEVRPFWPPLHLQAPYREAPRTDLSVVESFWEGVLPLPSSTGLTEAEQARVIDAVRAGLD
ncbi:MAG: aminotransferase class I/II-fold pyridoxal phosphate-dependent enzyme [Alphaproteobacteria bacterium]|jgi:dTDP-4-amino-4,6-dideoxygalactose transaminase|nr:aminotransferase class I/II-fold pyridoxal phosphate-dependent enzyme [Alphaproteobacteria bacterium]